MRQIYAAVYVILSVLATALFLPWAFLLGIFKGRQSQYIFSTKLARVWGRKVFNCTGSTIDIIGRENIPQDTTMVIVSNHQSDFDIPALLGHIDVPFGFIAKKELGKLPIFKRWMKYFGCVLIDRKDARKSLKAIQDAMKNIEEGRSQLIFPEGTRSKSGKIGHFKPGSLKIATKTNAVVLPVTIDGTYKMFEETKKIRKAHIKLTIHKPINTKELSEEEKKNLVEHVQEIIQSALIPSP